MAVMEVNKVADMVADMEVNKVTDMVANMELHKVAVMEVNEVADNLARRRRVDTQFGKKKKKG